MTESINLKEIERRAFRSTYQDGLWDLYFGLIVVGMSVFIYRPPSGYSPRNLLLALGAISLAGALLWAGKKYLTLPRMGQVVFSTQRKMRGRTLAFVMALVVLVQVAFVAFQLVARTDPGLQAVLGKVLPAGKTSDLLIASIGALYVGPSMLLMAYFTDFPRGYYIAILIALAVFLMIYLNQPVYPILVGLMIAFPGVILLVSFLKQHPLDRQARDG